MLHALRSFAIYGSSAGIAAVLPLIVLPILANSLGPSDYGLLSTARFAMQLAAIFVGSFLGFGLSRVFYESSAAAYYARINGANLTTLTLAICLGLIAIGLSWVLPDWIPALSLVSLIIVGAVGFVWRQNYHRVLVMIPRPALAAATEVLNNLLIFAGLLAALTLGAGWLGMVATQTAIFLLTAVATAGLIIKLRGSEGVNHIDMGWSVENLKRSLPFMVVGLVTPMLLTLDKVILGSVLGLERMGVYAATSLYLSGVFLLAGVFQKVYVPIVYQLLSTFSENGDPQVLAQAKRRMWQSQGAIVILIVLLAPLCRIHAAWALDDIYADAVRIVPIVVLAGISAFVQVSLIPFFDCFNRSRHLSALAFAGLALSFAGLFLGAQIADLAGAAWGLAIGQLGYCAAALILFSRQRV